MAKKYFRITLSNQNSNNMKKIKILKWSLVFGLIFSISFMLIANYKVVKKSEGKIYSTIEDIPKNRVGLLLGTSKLLKSGKTNYYFEYRIQATVLLFKAGKIEYVLISGDNGRTNYNEPQDMKDELMRRGVPESKIFLDYAGFRTFDSVYRAKEIFGQTSFTVISQEFHNQRAIYTANALNINAIGFNAQDVNAYGGFKTQVREKFARVKVILDLMFNKKPKFLGEKIHIE